MLAIAIAIVQIAAGDGTIRDIKALRNDMLKEIQNSIPDGSTLEVSFDRSNYVSSAIKEVYKTVLSQKGIVDTRYSDELSHESTVKIEETGGCSRSSVCINFI